MKLRSVKVVFMQGCAERVDIVSYGSCKFALWHIEAVDEIHELFIGESFEQWASGVTDGVPSHVRYLVFVSVGDETLYVRIKDT